MNTPRQNTRYRFHQEQAPTDYSIVLARAASFKNRREGIHRKRLMLFCCRLFWLCLLPGWLSPFCVRFACSSWQGAIGVHRAKSYDGKQSWYSFLYSCSLKNLFQQEPVPAHELTAMSKFSQKNFAKQEHDLARTRNHSMQSELASQNRLNMIQFSRNNKNQSRHEPR